MKFIYLLLALLLAFPSFAHDSVSGIDDLNPNISEEEQAKIDEAITTYYQHPEVKKVNIVLDIMNGELLRKRTAASPIVGFLTVIFANNKNHVFEWMSRNDYNNYAGDVFINALLHAGLQESALVFVQANGWKEEAIEKLRTFKDNTNLKKLNIILPGHIDTLWGAFFASGDEIYVDQIISVLFMKQLPPSGDTQLPPGDVLGENKKLASKTLKLYALSHKKVRHAIEERLN
ncbi:MAG: hypothetical protein WCJ33_05740, partial [Pseudomonadota bacterium]